MRLRLFTRVALAALVLGALASARPASAQLMLNGEPLPFQAVYNGELSFFFPFGLYGTGTASVPAYGLDSFMMLEGITPGPETVDLYGDLVLLNSTNNADSIAGTFSLIGVPETIGDAVALVATGSFTAVEGTGQFEGISGSLPMRQTITIPPIGGAFAPMDTPPVPVANTTIELGVPEPGTVGMLAGAGVPGLAFLLRRRRKP